LVFVFSSRRRHTRSKRDWSSDVCSSDLIFEKEIEFNPMMLTTSGVRISSSLGYEPDIFEATVKMIESGQIDPSLMITEEIELDRSEERGVGKGGRGRRRRGIGADRCVGS